MNIGNKGGEEQRIKAALKGKISERVALFSSCWKRSEIE